MNRREFLTHSLITGAALGLSSLGLSSLGRAPLYAAGPAQPRQWPDSPFLKGNFAPVSDELTVDSLEVLGELPGGLRGTFVRNGPNPVFPPLDRYHWFDGDGMVHAVSLEDGRAAYRNRYIQTQGLKVEAQAGQSLWPGLMDSPFISRAPRGTPRFKNTANTALVYHHEKLLALWEAGNPYELEVASLDTLGEYTFAGQLTSPMTAHPKVDPVTGELMLFGGRLMDKPHVLYSVFDAEGKLTHVTGVNIPRPVFMHDFAITERYSIFMDLPEVFTLRKVFVGKSPLHFDPRRGARIGIMPRHGKGSELRWFEIDPCYVFHTMAAWEEGDEVVLVACRFDRYPSGLEGGSRGLASEQQVNGRYAERAYLYRWRFNLKTGGVKGEDLDDQNSEFPQIHPARMGRKARYGYTVGDQMFGLHKYDLEGGGIERREVGGGRRSGEAIFVPHPEAAAEDHGWVLYYVYDPTSNSSELVIVDAQQFTAEPVARVLMPRRVPFGFHGLWVPGQA